MYEIFEKLLSLHNVTPYKVSKDTGIPYGALSDWKQGRSTPKKDKLEKIADYFGITVDYLLGRDKELEIGMRFSSDEEAKTYIEIMNNLEKLNEEGMNEVIKHLNYIVSLENYLRK